jgi:hypothetical protein
MRDLGCLESIGGKSDAFRLISLHLFGVQPAVLLLLLSSFLLVVVGWRWYGMPHLVLPQDSNVSWRRRRSWQVQYNAKKNPSRQDRQNSTHRAPANTQASRLPKHFPQPERSKKMWWIHNESNEDLSQPCATASDGNAKGVCCHYTMDPKNSGRTNFACSTGLNLVG